MKFAKCMREHGINVACLDAGGGVQIGIHGQARATAGPNPESPAFQAAQKACQGLLPFKARRPAARARPPVGQWRGKGGSGAGLAIGG